MKKVLVFATVGEGATGLALLIAPSLVECAYAVVNYEQAVEPFLKTDRLSDSGASNAVTIAARLPKNPTRSPSGPRTFVEAVRGYPG